MNSLKKIGAIGGAISLALCWPLAVGHIGQTIFQDEIAAWDSSMVDAELVTYDRGYLSSSAQTRLTVIDPAVAAQLQADGMPTSFVIDSDIGHGLFSLSGQSVIEENAIIPMTLETVTQLNGNTEFLLNVDAINYTDAASGLVVVAPASTLSGDMAMSGALNFVLDVPALEMNFTSGEQLSFTKIAGQGQGQQKNGYWLGKQSFTMGEVSLTENETTAVFNAQGLTYEGDTQLNAEQSRLNSEMTLRAKSLTMPSEPEVNDATFRFSLNDIDSQAFEAISQAFQDQSNGQTIDTASLIPQFERLFDQGFSVAIDEFSMRVGEGKFNLDILLEVPQGTSGVTQDPTKVVSATSGKLNSFVSDALVEGYPDLQQGVDELLIMEMLQQVEGGYQLNAQVSDGKIVFENGQEVPLFTLLMPVLM